MNAATGSKQQEINKVGMVQVTTAGVDPRTVMIHLHHASFTFAAVM